MPRREAEVEVLAQGEVSEEGARIARHVACDASAGCKGGQRAVCNYKPLFDYRYVYLVIPEEHSIVDCKLGIKINHQQI